MSIISNIFAGGAEGLLEGIGDLAKSIRVAITGIDPVKEAEIKAKLLELEFVARKSQADINLEEAKHPNVFVSGARPFILWVCGVALAWQFIGHPIFVWIITLAGSTLEPPLINTDGLTTLIISLLGLGGLRTFEKINGVQDKH